MRSGNAASSYSPLRPLEVETIEDRDAGTQQRPVDGSSPLARGEGFDREVVDPDEADPPGDAPLRRSASGSTMRAERVPERQAPDALRDQHQLPEGA
jgi:hypothetical protein